MTDNLKWFERLGYAAVIVDLLSNYRDRGVVLIGDVIFALVIAALIWAAARKGQLWAGWILILVLLMAIVGVVGEFAAPVRFATITSGVPEAPLQKGMDVVAMLLIAGALYFYFFGHGNRRAARLT